MKPLELAFTHRENVNSSPMESILADELKNKNVEFFREVQFQECINDKTGIQLRFDFYIPSRRMLVEYDGKNFHASDSSKYRDSIKDKFAVSKSIRLFRISSKDAIFLFVKRHFPNPPKRKPPKQKITRRNLSANTPKEAPNYISPKEREARLEKMNAILARMNKNRGS